MTRSIGGIIQADHLHFAVRLAVGRNCEASLDATTPSAGIGEREW